jgi:iron complex outermembrane receptor protein
VIHPTIYWNHNYDRYEGYHNRPDLLPYNYNRTDIIGLSMNSYFDWVAGRTAIGAELRNEDLVSANLGETLSRQHHIGGTNRYYTLGINRTNISTHIEHNVLLPHFTLSAGLVAVSNSWSNMNMSIFPGADATLRIGSCWKLHASANTSLRMPSFTEMYYKLQGYSANPHLKPEEMRAIEVGATYTVRNTRSDFQLNVWHHHGSNMIDWVMDTRLGDEAIWQSVNHTRINSIGAELSARLDCTALLPAQHVLKLITVNYSYISQEKKEEEYIVSQYALEYLRHKLVAKADVQIVPKLMLALDLRWQDRVGQYTDFDGNVCDYKPFCLLNARICWQASHYALHLEGNNLLGTHYVDYGHVPQPGTWITCGLTFTH